jgi:hypothetical protein
VLGVERLQLVGGWGGVAEVDQPTMSGLSAPPGAGAAVPSCAEVEGDCAKSGWVWKQSKHVKKWNKRYFVLWPKQPHPKKGRLLFYYTTPQVNSPRHRGTPSTVTLTVARLGRLLAPQPSHPPACARRTRSREG